MLPVSVLFLFCVNQFSDVHKVHSHVIYIKKCFIFSRSIVVTVNFQAVKHPFVNMLYV